MPQEPRILDKRQLAAGKFVALHQIAWQDAHGVERRWDSAERVRDAGAVLIIATLEPSDRLVLIRQFRPPANRYVVEFPAGLVDAGEQPEAAAARELREETGYVASDLICCPPAYTTPGLSNESVHIIQARIDETVAANQNPTTEFDASEMIETVLVARSDLPDFYRRECVDGVAFDAKLAAFIMALG